MYVVDYKFLFCSGLTLQNIHDHKQLVEWIIPNFSPNVNLDADMKLGGGFKYFSFSPLLGEMMHFDYRILFKWVGSTTNQEDRFMQRKSLRRMLSNDQKLQA